MNLSEDSDSYFDSDGSYYDYDEDIYYDRYEIIKVVEQVNGSYELLPDTFNISGYRICVLSIHPNGRAA